MIEVKRKKLGAAATEGACVEDALRELIRDMVPPRRLLRRQLGRNLRILERDGWRCSNPMCRARSRLHVHHIVFRSHGGSNDPSNLITLCLACHVLVHSGRLTIVGRAPNQVLFSTPIGEVWCEGLRVAA
jgi:5-methylcytosine-specific restriction endonuclease McrA